ncbi:hypothetical protein [Streptomyces caeruleatus]|nr:hypothetical protein [Streptomyces caeruleatus]
MTFPRHLTDLPLLRPGDSGYDDELAGSRPASPSGPTSSSPPAGPPM